MSSVRLRKPMPLRMSSLHLATSCLAVAASSDGIAQTPNANANQLPEVTIQQGVKPKAAKPKAAKAPAPAPADLEPVVPELSLPPGVVLSPEAASQVTATTAGPTLGYKALTSVTANKTSTAIANTPSTINVVPREVIDDTASARLSDAIEYVPGTITAQGFGGTVDQYVIRGFNTFRILRNGMPMNPDQALNGPRDLANVERVEVLKGPAAMLFGRQEPGSAINFVTKEPLDTASTSIKQTIGSYGFYRTELDTTGPLLSSGAVTYRFNAAFEDANSFRDFVSSDRIFLAPTVSVKLSQSTKVKLELEYLEGTETLDWGIPAIGGKPAQVSRDRFLGEPGQSDNRYEELLLGASLEHKFSNDLILRAQFNSQTSETSFDSNFPLGFFTADDRTLFRFQSAQRGRETDLLFGSVNLEGHAKTGAIEHTVLVGFDRNSMDTLGHAFSGCCLAIDIFAPAYGQLAAYGPERRQDIQTDWWGVYIQDQMKLPGNVYITAGLRYDEAETSSVTTNTGTGVITSSEVSNEAVSPRIGALWKATESFSVFANYVEGLGNPNSATSISGGSLDPETGV